MLRRTAILTLAGAPALTASLSGSEDSFLEDLSHRCFRYFWENADPATGLVLDRVHTDGARTTAARNIASIAATGFGLTALCIAAERRWMPKSEARDRVRTTLRAIAGKLANEKGWLYHFVNASTGERSWKCEISSIDTALLLAGALAARGYFTTDDEIRGLATKLYDRIDFRWMMNGGDTLTHGWKPESGFLTHRWSRYSECLLLYALAIGSTTNAIPPDAWDNVERPTVTYGGIRYVEGGPLFIHQYPQAWLDLRGLTDEEGDGTDYFENSKSATRANRLFCLSLRDRFPKSYSETIWGITSSDSAKGYVAWGVPGYVDPIDGTVVPCAAGGSLMFEPEICLETLRAMHRRYADRLWGRYGFADAFNPTTGWFDTDVLGIDLGITLLSTENLRTGNVWRWFMKNPEMPVALQRMGFRRSGD